MVNNVSIFLFYTCITIIIFVSSTPLKTSEQNCQSLKRTWCCELKNTNVSAANTIQLDVSRVNISMSKTFDTWSAAKAIDGSLEMSADACLCCAATIAASPRWLQVDFSSIYLIQVVQILGRNDSRCLVHYIFCMLNIRLNQNTYVHLTRKNSYFQDDSRLVVWQYN